MVVIGITGPTGVGKTTVLKVLAELGAAVVDCDETYHELLRTCRPMLDELRERFGGGIFGEDGLLRRKALGDIVFGRPEALADLNAITHRYVVRRVDEFLARAKEDGRPAAAVDAVALIESGLADRCDVTVAVTAGDGIRAERIMAREGISEEYARRRIAAQRPSSWYEARCAHTLRNAGSKEELEEAARSLFLSIIPKEEIEIWKKRPPRSR